MAAAVLAAGDRLRRACRASNVRRGLRDSQHPAAARCDRCARLGRRPAVVPAARCVARTDRGRPGQARGDRAAGRGGAPRKSDLLRRRAVAFDPGEGRARRATAADRPTTRRRPRHARHRPLRADSRRDRDPRHLCRQRCADGLAGDRAAAGAAGVRRRAVPDLASLRDHQLPAAVGDCGAVPIGAVPADHPYDEAGERSPRVGDATLPRPRPRAGGCPQLRPRSMVPRPVRRRSGGDRDAAGPGRPSAVVAATGCAGRRRRADGGSSSDREPSSRRDRPDLARPGGAVRASVGSPACARGIAVPTVGHVHPFRPQSVRAGANARSLRTSAALRRRGSGKRIDGASRGGCDDEGRVRRDRARRCLDRLSRIARGASRRSPWHPAGNVRGHLRTIRGRQDDAYPSAGRVASAAERTGADRRRGD